MHFRGGRPSLRARACLAIFCLALLPLKALGADSTSVPSPSNYGGVGLMDMRTARFFPDGYLSLTTSFTQPDDRYAITFQALPWAEFTFRYAITRAIFDTGVPLHDRSFDVKFRLSNETEYSPQLALGFQDVLGTGVYSGEYFVGSKRWGPFDFTVGIGWGRLASRGTFENPFGLLGDSFLTRKTDFGFGGVPLLKSYFRGPDIGLFGGIEYNTPIENLTLKVEYSSDAYKPEKIGSGRDFSFPVNVGVSYRPFQWLDLGLSLMHGKYAGLRISALLDVTKENWQARLDPPPPFRARADAVAPTLLQPINPDSSRVSSSVETQTVNLRAGPDSRTEEANIPAIIPANPVNNLSGQPEEGSAPPREVNTLAVTEHMRELDADTLERLRLGFDNQKLALLGGGYEGDKLVVVIENGRYRRDTEAISRAARVLSAAAPGNVEYFEITTTRTGQPLATVLLPRIALDKLAQHDGSPAEVFYASEIKPAGYAPLVHIQPGLFPQFGAFAYPVFRQSLFDPNNPVFVEFGVGSSAGLRLTRSWFVEATGVLSLYNDFDQIKRSTNSVLPHVRSDIAEYLKKEKFGLENLSTSYYFKLAPEIFGRITGGYLERMFAGFGGELLYRPFGRRWAVGVDLWDVRQRGYDVLLDLRHYTTLTGHITAYYELPWHDVELAVSAGRYLAGDKGLTFEVGRRFSTGIHISAWATFTNVSAQQFGEGSFDKGIRIVIPFEWAAPFATQSGYDLGLRPIQRDGGQRLDGDAVLYGMTQPSSYGTLTSEWNSVFK
jgi:hypothetical protein